MDLPVFYDEQEEWSHALLLYDAALKELNTKLEIWNNEFKLAHQYNPIEHITSRIKSPQSIAKKMKRYGYDLNMANIFEFVNDIAGIRIICSFTSDIYKIAELIAAQSDVRVIQIKDYIKNPKENGYKSYHMIVTVPISLSKEIVDTKVEIQIRTIAMDFWASLEHKIYYKYEGNAPEGIRRELKECADVVDYLDMKMLSINEKIHGQEGNVFDDMMIDVDIDEIAEITAAEATDIIHDTRASGEKEAVEIKKTKQKNRLITKPVKNQISRAN